jgi:hypothetical protein
MRMLRAPPRSKILALVIAENVLVANVGTNALSLRKCTYGNTQNKNM